MFKKEKEYVGISLDDDVLKVAYLKSTPAGKNILGAVKQDIKGQSEEDLSSSIKTVLGELGVKKPRAVCALPLNLVTTKNIEIPSLDPQEIASIIDLQAGRHTPYSREEILVGYINIGVFQRNYTKILLIIVNRDVIKKQLNIFENAGVRIDKVLFAPEGLAAFYAQALGVKEEDTPVGIIDVANQRTNFTIEFNKTAAMCRSIPLGMKHLIKEGQDAQDKWIAELAQSIETYQSEDINQLPESYILTSDDAKLKELQPILQEKLKANVKIMPYLERVEASQPVMLKLVSEYNDDSFLDVISAGTMMDDVQVDLTPEEIKTQRAIEEKGREVIKAGILAIVLLVFVCSIFISKVHFKRIFYGKIQDEYTAYRKKVVSLDRVAQKTRLIKGYLNTRMVSLNIINELYRIVPDEIYLQSVFIDENGIIDIQGISESMSIVFNFVSNLEASELFKKVKPKSTTDAKDRGKDVAAFHIEFMLESTDDALERFEDEATGEEEA